MLTGWLMAVTFVRSPRTSSAPVWDSPASITGAGADPTASVAMGLLPYCRLPPCSPSLHDAEGQMRDACTLDHPGELQLDRLGALFEQPDAIPE
jgi:hypothetical protein